MIKVVLESPYGAETLEEVAHNVEYARACIKDCFRRGEAALASHLLYTQPGILDDRVASQRKLGIEAGFTWNLLADKIVVYGDRGISHGMKQGIELAVTNNIPIEYRKLYGDDNGRTPKTEKT